MLRKILLSIVSGVALIIHQNSKSEFPKDIETSFATGLSKKGYTVSLGEAFGNN